ncbi:MAG: phosphatase PAP2 family protein [Thermoplasmata archaeon]|nr:phosphatase PAP2 family protein [Thermoplasmata archaeon]
MVETILGNFFIAITQFGAELFYMIFLPPIFWCLNKKFGFRLLYLTLLAGYIAALLKNIVQTPRPPKAQWKVTPEAYGFPSGHAMGTTSLWGYLIVKLRTYYILILGLAIIILVSISRIYLGVHYPIDVIGGIIFGIAIILGFIVFEPKLSSIINKLNFIQQLAIGCSVPIILSIFAFLSMAGNGDNRVILGAGALLGVTLGYIIESETTNFNLEVTITRKVFRIFIGFLIALGVYFGLGALLPNTVVWEYLIAFLGGINVTLFVPWVFTSIERR